ncbi:MAG: hypothetical protein Q4C61_17090 [Lachnospiraceae bacterium]|nr:hypothetical protein [Lachnospiraceae bacterium]
MSWLIVLIEFQNGNASCHACLCHWGRLRNQWSTGLWNPFWQIYAIAMAEGLFDRFFIDWYWAEHTKAWTIPGTEDIPFVQTWGQVLKKRGVLTLIWAVGAAIVGLLVILIF